MSTPKAFTSYSWDDDNHKLWIADLATRLREDGVETILDQWHTVPGDQLPQFMEREIRDNDYVLIICTPRYRMKSDEREGGVGYEGDIMTAEVHTLNNHRKFIPILAKGTWKEASPSWLKGKYYIDLSTPTAYDHQYPDLLTTVLGSRPSAPPVKKRTRADEESTISVSSVVTPVEPIKIVGVIVDEITEPTLDGTPGCALYKVPFQLSRKPSSLWKDIFLQTWNHPPSYTNMHRSGIASVYGDKISLDGTTIEEVENYHRDTLVLCVNEANKKEKQKLQRLRQEEERSKQRTKEHRSTVNKISKRLKFE